MHGTPHIVSDVMTHTVAAIGRGATFKEIVRMMQEWKVSALPVVEGEGRVVGVVSEADLLPKQEFRDSDPDRYTQLRRLSDLAKAGAVTAGELMTAPALTTSPDATLAQAARTMARAKVKRLPVVDEEGMVQGIVSRADLLKVFLRHDDEIAEEVRREVVSYLFPPPVSAVRVEVHEGVVKLLGRVRDTSLVPVAARLVRAVEGVVDVDFEVTGNGRSTESTASAASPSAEGASPAQGDASASPA
ncbi:CBS domain-containing protein [Streptomyces blattellae]|uniref:CBS domain-containing protein n=1 Tax=Streptomyces blattellae TaxID=2569855 RepID=UPI0012B7852C|nr:CBS domain-containing protein [Streptomyces blattellae]